MDKKQRLIKLYEGEIEKIREIKEDILSLENMTDEQLFVLVEKAQKLHRVLEKNWKQISGDDLKCKDVRPVLLWRDTLNKDFQEIHQLEDEISMRKTDLKAIKKEAKKYYAQKKEERAEYKNKAILAISFGVMFVCALIFHLIMFQRYHYLILPAFVLMTALPLFLCIFYAFSLKRNLAADSDDAAEQELTGQIQALKQEIEEKQELLDEFDQKYQTVFEELDEYQMQAYPYVEQIIHKLEYRENYRRAKNEYCGILELLHFKQPEVYLFIPEIFLIEEEMEQFLSEMEEKMRKLDEYLVQTIETA